MLKASGLALQRLFYRWVYRRLPPSKTLSLNSHNLFIFPSKAGFGFLFLMLLCWLVATNYENNLVFAITCLLTSVFVVAILHSFSNLSGLTLTYLRATPAFSGENAVVELMLSQKHGRYKQARCRDNLSISFTGGEVVTVSMIGQETIRVDVPVLVPKRGCYQPGRIQVESVYPLGLLRVWTKIDLDIWCLVYPRPIFNHEVSQTLSGRGQGALQLNDGSEDFVGLNDYRPGDSLKRIAWKQYAREQGLYAKHYADYRDERIWLDWDALSGLDTESRLSVLCGMLLQTAATDHHYGLRLPGIEISPGHGERHKTRLLRELALFESSEEKRFDAEGASLLNSQQGTLA